MMDIESVKESARKKLVGYTEREIECYVQGAIFMAGHLPQKHNDEWYRQRDERRTEAKERSGEVCKLLQDTSGLKAAVDAINGARTEGEVIDHAFEVVFTAMLDNPQFRNVMLDMLGAEDKSVSAEIISRVTEGCRAFNRTHATQLDFSQLDEDSDRWTLTWDEPA